MTERYFHIETYSNRGHGLCKPDEGKRLVEIPRTLEGEDVLAEVGPRKKSYRRGFLKEIVKKSPFRTEPKCKHFNLCGGCSWQHMTYEAQLETKSGIIQRLFNAAPEPIHPSPDVWAYRNKMEFSFAEGKYERMLGLMPFNRKLAFNVTGCEIVSSWMNDALDKVRLFWEQSGLLAFNFRTGEGALRTLTLRESKTTKDKMAILTVSGDSRFSLSRSELNQFCKAIQASTTDKLSIYLKIWQSIRGQPTRFFTMHLSGPETIEESYEQVDELAPIAFNIGSEAFFQPNSLQAREMARFLYSQVQSLQKEHKLAPSECRLIDLYCGLGFFTLQLAPLFGTAIGIELVKEAIIDAEANAKANGLNQCSFQAIDAKKGLKSLLESNETSTLDVLLIDPPREGCHSAIDEIMGLSPKVIFYISCNPKTQAIDIESFKESGYQVKLIKPFDQFPHTPHIENIAILSRDG
jgi:23S rRNA (uracil1939-C5)-methyltransferase